MWSNLDYLQPKISNTRLSPFSMRRKSSQVIPGYGMFVRCWLAGTCKWSCWSDVRYLQSLNITLWKRACGIILFKAHMPLLWTWSSSIGASSACQTTFKAGIQRCRVETWSALPCWDATSVRAVSPPMYATFINITEKCKWDWHMVWIREHGEETGSTSINARYGIVDGPPLTRITQNDEPHAVTWEFL